MARRARSRPRADAQRSVAAILDAAVEVLCIRPDASVDEIAKAAGLTRQTVYAHFASREALMAAVLDRVTRDVLAELDAAKVDEGPPSEALERLIRNSWRTVERYPFLLHAPPASTQEEERERHGPVLEHFHRLIRRGQSTGDFDSTFPPEWLGMATMALGHAAGEEVRAGRMSTDDATRMLTESLHRLFSSRRRSQKP